MRKEIKRKLLVWPLIASASITAISFIQIHTPRIGAFAGTSGLSAWLAQRRSDLLGDQPLVNAWAANKTCSHDDTFIGADHRILAPIRNENYELAGMVNAPLASNTLTQVNDESASTIDRLLINLLGQEWAGGVIGETTFGSPMRQHAGFLDLTGSHSDNVGAGKVSVNSNAIGTRALAHLRRREPTLVVEPATLASLNTEIPEGVIELLPQNVRNQKSVLETTTPRRSMLPKSVQVLAKPAPSETPTATSPAGWPQTPRLMEQIDTLRQTVQYTAGDDVSAIARWTDRIVTSVESLQLLTRLGDPAAAELIEQLETYALDGLRSAELVKDRDTQMNMLRVAHALNRRVSVWKPISELNQASDSNRHGIVWKSSEASPSSVHAAIAAVRRDVAASEDRQTWADYLLLEDLDRAALNATMDRSVVAQRVLSRLDWHALDSDQLLWLSRPSVQRLADAIRPWTAQAIDYAELLRQIERQESDAIDLAAIDIAGSVQTLRFADRDHARNVAGSLNTHYRNANVRLAMSEAMLNRLLPSVEPKTVPVRTQVLGSQVRGISQIKSDLQVSLNPTAQHWSLNLQTLGNVSSLTTGKSGPVAIRTSGSSDFVANAPILVTREGVTLGNVAVDVRGRTKLRGIRSQYDGWPLVGALVRSYANNKFDSMKPASSRIVSNQIRSQVASEVDTKLDEQVDIASEKLSKMVLGPLGRMKLDPQVIDMQTTEQRLVARYRLAGDWQLAAFTPRPRAPRTSLMSVQAHQSAINNTLEQLVPREEPMSISDVAVHAADMFGQSIEIPADVPDDVVIQFARTRPITVEVEDGKMWITLRVTKLKRGESLRLTNFIVRALYRPEANGLQASLVRDGHLRISGPNMSMRERLPVRAIFNKVLSADRPLPLTLPALVQHPSMEGLAISQMELRDGWIAIAVSEHNEPKVAWNTVRDVSTK
ncbi:hypothetical protein Pla22_33410 [Rubripirellula amarantea]|uniref:Uncharacterized protein n=1 Tax=Rubripirellula amarantea TaxID=2527999 RepID=A0A5C5WIN4_9BACT|nr:hypothetical protein [Rubripirellula amarantea]TWT50598.1 hypothetical protein Pla22_33410 [Rubripirellula amarantea]